MPTYEYECVKCKDRFEAFQSISAEPLKECVKCKGALRRLIGAGSGFIFKGPGFYATDYRSSGYKEAQKKDSPAAPACDKPKTPACANCPSSKEK